MPGRRLGAAPRRHQRVDHVRALGTARSRRPGGRGGWLRGRQSTAASRSCRPKAVDIDGVRTLASRISYVGELGWEIYVPIEQGLRVWDALWRAGRPHGLVPVGIGTYAVDRPAREGLSSPRRRARARLRPRRGRDGSAESSRTPTSSGRAAYERAAIHAAGRGPVHADGGRPDVVERGQALHARPRADPDARRRSGSSTRRAVGSYVTSAGSGPSVGKHLLMTYLPPEQAVVGTSLAVEYFGERYPVTVAVAGAHTALRPGQHPDPRAERPDRAWRSSSASSACRPPAVGST